MYEPTKWLDHITTIRNVFREVDNEDGTTTHYPVEGEVIQQGTPMDATRFNNMESGIKASTVTLLELVRMSQFFNRELKGLHGEMGVVTLRNGQQHPFNDSSLVVALRTPRDTTEYIVDIELISMTNGFVRQLVITNKLLNGFSLSYIGDARSVKIAYIVRGGVSR